LIRLVAQLRVLLEVVLRSTDLLVAPALVVDAA